MEQYTRLGWEYIGYEPTPTEIDEKTLNLLVYVDTFLDKVLKEYVFGYKKVYAGIATVTDEFLTEGDCMIIVVVAPRSNYSKKQLKVYGAAIQAENEFEEKYDMPIDISYMANSKHLNEKVLAGDGFFFKKVNTK